MDVKVLQILSGDQSVDSALSHVAVPSFPAVLFRRGINEVRLIKPSQLNRFQGLVQFLQEIPDDASEQVRIVSAEEAAPYNIQTTIDTRLSNVEGLMTNLNARLACVSIGQVNFLISASEQFLVDYHCEPDNHPWDPSINGPLGPNTKCWCGNPIREA